MFDIGASELLLIVIVAIVVIGPKDLPVALRTAGRWIGKARRMSSHLRAGVDAMIREAELEEMQAKWREQNEAIMRQTADAGPYSDEPQMTPLPVPGSAESAVPPPVPDQPQLPLRTPEPN